MKSNIMYIALMGENDLFYEAQHNVYRLEGDKDLWYKAHYNVYFLEGLQ